MTERKRKKRRSVKFPEPEFLPDTNVGSGKWDERYVRFGFFLSLLGVNDVQMAQTLGVSRATLDIWKRKKPKFMEALRRGKTEADGKVAHSLFLAAVGYSHPDQVVMPNRVREYDKDGKIVKEYTKPLIVETVKNYPPNVTAAVKWLQARQPEQWGHKLNIMGQVSHTHKLDLTNFSNDELEVLKKLGVAHNGVEDVDYENV